MGGSLKRKLAREQRQNEAYSSDTAHALERPLTFDAALTENQIKAIARSKFKMTNIEADRASKKQIKADDKAWLAQNDWLWEK